MSNTIVVLGKLAKDFEMKEVGENTVFEVVLYDKVYAGKGKGENDQDGNPTDHITNWWKFSLWNDNGSKKAPYLLKGREFQVTGTVANRKYETENGKGISTELRNVRLEFTAGSWGDEKPQAKQNSSSPAPAPPSSPATDDDMPF